MTAASETAIIVVAAGSGTRLAAGAPKAFVDLDGRSILRHALSAVVATKPRQVVVVVPAGFEESARTDLELVSARGGPRATVVVGGATRQLSVAAGLAVVEEGVATVLVHDAARALTPSEVISAVQAAVTSDVGVVPVLPVVDTLKRVRADLVVGAVDRDTLAAAQTPQGFPRVLLDDAYARAAASGSDYTDDAALFAAAGQSVRTIPGSPRAFKITTPADLRRARSELAESAAPDPGARSTHPFGPPRIGIGTDVHAFADSGPLWLAGLCWPEDRALAGHSDGDVVAHAMVDALLAAAGAGDIGEHFGTGQPQFADAHAAVFLARTREIVLAAGFEIGNVSVQFQGPRPLFRPRRAEAEQALSAALGGAAVSVSATTTDGLGFPGRGEGIAATAVALVHPRRLVR